MLFHFLKKALLFYFYINFLLHSFLLSFRGGPSLMIKVLAIKTPMIKVLTIKTPMIKTPMIKIPMTTMMIEMSKLLTTMMMMMDML